MVKALGAWMLLVGRGWFLPTMRREHTKLFMFSLCYEWVYVRVRVCLWSRPLVASCRGEAPWVAAVCYGDVQLLALKIVIAAVVSHHLKWDCGAAEHSHNQTTRPQYAPWKQKCIRFCVRQQRAITKTVSVSCFDHWLLKHGNCPPRRKQEKVTRGLITPSL